MEPYNLYNRCLKTLIACCVVASMIGCDKIGQTPAGGSDAEVKAAFDKAPIEERVKITMGSPAPAADKLARIKDMYAKEGKQVPKEIEDQLSGGGGSAH
jgi:hypothetical protein